MTKRVVNIGKSLNKPSMTIKPGTQNSADKPSMTIKPSSGVTPKK